MSHTCHAEGCNVPVPPRMFMCARHWGRVPPWLQAGIWRFYVPGQERTKVVSKGYLVVQARARIAVAEAEGADATGAVRDLVAALIALGAPLVGIPSELWANRDVRAVIDDKIRRQIATPKETP